MAKRRRLRSIGRYFSRSSRDPEALARGLGLGLFVGFLPSFGIQIVVAVLVAGVINANRIIAALGTLISNPLTTVPLSIASIWIGDFVIPGTQFSDAALSGIAWKNLFSNGYLIHAYLVGCLTLSILGGALGYLGARLYFARVKRAGAGGYRA